MAVRLVGRDDFYKAIGAPDYGPASKADLAEIQRALADLRSSLDLAAKDIATKRDLLSLAATFSRTVAQLREDLADLRDKVGKEKGDDLQE